MRGMRVPAASFPGNQWANLRSIFTLSNRKQRWPPCPACRALPSVCRTLWGETLRPCFRQVSFPHALSHWCLCHWLGSFFSPEAGQVQGLHTCREQPGDWETPVNAQTLESKEESGKLWGPRVPGEHPKSCRGNPTSMWGPMVAVFEEWGPPREYRELIHGPEAVVAIPAAITVEKRG